VLRERDLSERRFLDACELARVGSELALPEAIERGPRDRGGLQLGLSLCDDLLVGARRHLRGRPLPLTPLDEKLARRQICSGQRRALALRAAASGGQRLVGAAKLGFTLGAGRELTGKRRLRRGLDMRAQRTDLFEGEREGPHPRPVIDVPGSFLRARHKCDHVGGRSEGMSDVWTRDPVGVLFRDREDAGRQLAHVLERLRGRDLVVLGLPRGGVVVAAEVARELDAALDAVAVRKVGHPLQPEYALGAVSASGRVYVRDQAGLSEEELAGAVEVARARAIELDGLLHGQRAAVELAGKRALVVDDGLATGATMIAALRAVRDAGAARVLAAAPVAAAQSTPSIRVEADEAVFLYELAHFWSVGSWYERFDQTPDEHVIRLLGDS
jgi:predicted phosphoribosyltransferase